ncbi:MAG: hypothetical protein ACP5FK_01615 [bacterium]
MKKLVIVMPLIIILAIFGCTKDDSNPTGPGGGGPAAPTNVTIQATNDGLGIIITWTAVANADSYMVQTPDVDVIVAGNQTSYTDNAPGTMGTYRVRAYDDNTAGDWSSSYSTSPVSGSGTIYEWDASGHSCFYWDVDGNGYTISRLETAAISLTDIFLYDNNTSDLYIFCSQEQPLGGTKTTYLYYDGSTTSPYAHTTPWYNGWIAGVNNMGGYYWVELSSGRYVRLKLTTVSATSVSFSFLYQTVQGFRYVE